MTSSTAGWRRAAPPTVGRGVVEHQDLGLERDGLPLARDRVEAAQQQLALLRC